MIKAIINGVVKLVVGLVSLILAPIDALIAQFLPGLDSAFSSISSLFTNLGSIVPWVISYLGLNEVTVTIIIDLITFILTVPLMVSTIKLAVRWYNKLKL